MITNYFFSYALVHASRKTLSTVKPSLITEWTDNSTGEQPVFPDEHSAEQFLALLDGSFLVAYAVGLYLGGTLGDHYDPTKVLACGMWASAVTVFLFGILKWLPFHSPAFYALTWIACGLFQSVAWPTEISIMGSWFGHNSRGAVLGLWSSCASIGNIIGTLVSSHTIQLGYEYSFVANACSLFFGAFFIFFCLSPHPIEHGRDAVISDTNDAETPKAISIFRAWCLPGVLAYSLAYACLKLVNYSLFFWLPFYLHAHYEWEESVADAFSTWFDLGGIIAAVLIGIASDHFSSRTPILIFMLFLSMGSLFIYANSPNDVLVNSFLMALTGFFVGGPSNLISSAVATDLGEAGEIRGSARALSTVTGIIDGTGSIGAGIGQLLIPKIEASFGWIAVFYGFIVMMFWAILCLIPLLWKELISRSRPRYVHLHTGRSEDSSESYSDNISDSGIAKVEAAIGVRHRNSPDS
ncbi:unnamed protein product [Thelazia callipaeda]|uniref:Sugar phosphate exchanger 3 n=1 Tax=Thelazia callipaeda TaxID=103827 RepID=A0A0N5D658_THECL|nr:unnamed protein product [Thelazia callipaeda]